MELEKVTIWFSHAHLHRFIYYHGHTPRSTADQILSIVVHQVGCVLAEFMANQMVTFLSSMALPKLGQIFMVGSMTWVIGPDGNGEIMEAVQDHPTLIVLTLIMTYLVPAPCH